MKKTKIIYWTSTILFAGFMAMSAVPDVMMVPEAVSFINHLGYPNYFIPFIGVAKLLGAIAILLPQLKKLKEWAYAGLIFDLIGAVYSNIMVDGFKPDMFMMVPIFGLAIISYIYNEKLHNL